LIALRQQEIDWSGIRAAAIALNSVRLAAIKASQHLPTDEQRRFVERVNKRAYRERWMEKARAMSQPKIAGALPLSKNVQTGSDVLKETLTEDSRETRIGLSAAARKAAETFAKMPGKKVIKHAQAHRHVTRSASVLHGWDDKGNPVPFSLNVLNIGSCGIEIRER
jgi:hypothetical protein